MTKQTQLPTATVQRIIKEATKMMVSQELAEYEAEIMLKMLIKKDAETEVLCRAAQEEDSQKRDGKTILHNRRNILRKRKAITFGGDDRNPSAHEDQQER